MAAVLNEEDLQNESASKGIGVIRVKYKGFVIEEA